MMQSSNGTNQPQQPHPHAAAHHMVAPVPPQSPHHHVPWMAYPGARMAMQYQMMPQHYAPQFMVYPPQQHHVHQHHGVNGGGGGGGVGDATEENKTIWIGDLYYWMDENYLHNCFALNREVNSIKVIRNKQTGQSEGYGFVEFASHADAENVLNNFSGAAMPNADQPFKLNWASFSMGDRRTEMGSDRSIFVGDLASDVSDILLQETFSSKYPSVKGAKVVMDATTGRSKGYGFVRFGDDAERTRAMSEMNGAYCSSRPMRIGLATPRKSAGYQQGGYASNGGVHGLQSDGDSTNTTIFVGGLDASVTEEDLRQTFSQNGEIVNVKIPVGKGCGFVQFGNRSSAEEALQKLNGTVIGKQTVRLSWGRNPANNKQFRASEPPPSPWNGGYYGQAYDGYGYAGGPPQDQSMYAAASPYGAYPLYGSNQQVS